MSNILVGIFLIFAINFTKLDGANILALYPMPSRSHANLGMSLLEELARRGHQITFISPFESGFEDINPNITLVSIASGMQGLMEAQNNVNFLKLHKNSPYRALSNVVQIGKVLANYTLSHPNVQKILEAKTKFDLFLLDLFLHDSLLGVANHFNIPTVVFSSSGTIKWSNEMVKNPINPSYNPNMLLPHSDKMSFLERFKSSIFFFYEEFIYHYVNLPTQEAIYRDHFGKFGKPLPKLLDLVHNVNLVLLNTHPLLQYPRAFVPNMVDVGGIHLKTDQNLLGDEILDYMSAASSVIYVSFGSNAKFSDLPDEKLKAFFNVFNEMKRTLILLKFEDREKAFKLKNPRNIILGEWLPQQEILSHPNVKVFITHGGLMSCMEAVNYGKPIIGVPIFGDQHFNVRRAVEQGYGLKLDYNNITVESLKESIDRILGDDSYQKNAERLSKVFQDTPIKPLDKAVFYIEHVLRTKGADHLRSSATQLSWWSIHLTDIGFFLVLILAIIILIPLLLVNLLVKLVGGKAQKTQQALERNFLKKSKKIKKVQ